MQSGPENDSIETGEPSVVTQAWKSLTDSISYLNLNYQLNYSNIFMAIYENELRLIQKFLDDGADVNARISQDSLTPRHNDSALHDSTALHLASRFHVDIEIMKYLLKRGANIEARNPYDQTPLHIAVQKGNIEHVKILLHAGAKTDVRDREGRTPLHFACQKMDTAFSDALLQAGADPEVQDNQGSTAMHYAVINNNQFAICMLLNHDANTEACDFQDKTPLHLAATRSLAIKKLFIDYNANFNVTDKRGKTPVFYEVEEYQVKKEDLQFVNEESVKTRDNEGNTVLHIVAKTNCQPSLKRILKCNPDIHAKNNDGDAPIDIAYQYGKHYVITQLEYLGAKLQKTSTPIVLGSPGKVMVLQQQHEKNKHHAASSSSSSASRARKALKDS